MPCNGNGHPPDCNCGWGGVFYGADGVSYSLQHWQRPESHTNPNTKCRHCGQGVYFYRSPDGGSVFFDELGSPWPKHQCMGMRNAQSPQPPAPQSGGVKRKQWPFLWREKWPLPNKEGTALVDMQDRPLFVRARGHAIPLWTPVWISKHPNGVDRYSISLPLEKNGEVKDMRFDAFTLRSLTVPDNAKYFQETIKIMNAGAMKAEFNDASDA
jgi:hypothetical protein